MTEKLVDELKRAAELYGDAKLAEESFAGSRADPSARPIMDTLRAATVHVLSVARQFATATRGERTNAQETEKA